MDKSHTFGVFLAGAIALLVLLVLVGAWTPSSNTTTATTYSYPATQTGVDVCARTIFRTPQGIESNDCSPHYWNAYYSQAAQASMYYYGPASLGY